MGTALHWGRQPATRRHRIVSMSAPPTLDTIDARLSSVERKLDQIHVALVGSPDGAVKGLQMRFDGLASRVERLEGWGRWLSGVVTALIIAAAIQAWRG